MSAVIEIIDHIIKNPVVQAPPPVLDNKGHEAPKKPNMHPVVLWNGDSTNLHLVAQVLTEVFNMERQKAMSVMMAAHNGTKATVEIYSQDVAEAKVAQGMAMVQTNARGHNGRSPEAPCALTFTAEPESDGE